MEGWKSTLLLPRFKGRNLDGAARNNWKYFLEERKHPAWCLCCVIFCIISTVSYHNWEPTQMYLLCSLRFSKSGQFNKARLLKQNLISLGITFNISPKLSIIFIRNLKPVEYSRKCTTLIRTELKNSVY